MKIDNMNLLYKLSSEQNANLRTNIDYKTLTEYVDKSDDTSEDCGTLPKIKKLYTTLEELQSDNNKEIYVDPEYDDTDYSIKMEYSSEQSKMNTVDFKKYYLDDPFKSSGLALFNWSPIADELKNLDKKIVLNSIKLKWNLIIEEFKNLTKDLKFS